MDMLCGLHAASEAKVLGHRGITLVQKATGVARNSIKLGLKELLRAQHEGVAEGDAGRRLRRIGGGRKASVKDDTKLIAALESLVEPVTRGDPESVLRWTCKSLRQLEAELRSQGYVVSHTSIGICSDQWDIAFRVIARHWRVVNIRHT